MCCTLAVSQVDVQVYRKTVLCTFPRFLCVPFVFSFPLCCLLMVFVFFGFVRLHCCALDAVCLGIFFFFFFWGGGVVWVHFFPWGWFLLCFLFCFLLGGFLFVFIM